MPFKEGTLKKAIQDEYTANRKDHFIEALKRVHNVRVSCEIIGITRRTAYDWRNADIDFKERWDEAIQFSREALESATYLKAIRGTTPAAITASIFMLKGMYPEKYAERVQYTNFTIDWSKVPDSVLERFNAGELTLQDVYEHSIQQERSEPSPSEVGRSERSSTQGASQEATEATE